MDGGSTGGWAFGKVEGVMTCRDGTCGVRMKM